MLFSVFDLEFPGQTSSLQCHHTFFLNRLSGSKHRRQDYMIYQSINQSIKQPTNQPTNQSVNQYFHQRKQKQIAIMIIQSEG